MLAPQTPESNTRSFGRARVIIRSRKKYQKDASAFHLIGRAERELESQSGGEKADWRAFVPLISHNILASRVRTELGP